MCASHAPTFVPTVRPTHTPTESPTGSPSVSPTLQPTGNTHNSTKKCIKLSVCYIFITFLLFFVQELQVFRQRQDHPLIDQLVDQPQHLRRRIRRHCRLVKISSYIQYCLSTEAKTVFKRRKLDKWLNKNCCKRSFYMFCVMFYCIHIF